jgi:hypothetical protein
MAALSVVQSSPSATAVPLVHVQPVPACTTLIMAIIAIKNTILNDIFVGVFWLIIYPKND